MHVLFHPFTYGRQHLRTKEYIYRSGARGEQQQRLLRVIYCIPVWPGHPYCFMIYSFLRREEKQFWRLSKSMLFCPFSSSFCVFLRVSWRAPICSKNNNPLPYCKSLWTKVLHASKHTDKYVFKDRRYISDASITVKKEQTSNADMVNNVYMWKDVLKTLCYRWCYELSSVLRSF